MLHIVELAFFQGWCRGPEGQREDEWFSCEKFSYPCYPVLLPMGGGGWVGLQATTVISVQENTQKKNDIHPAIGREAQSIEEQRENMYHPRRSDLLEADTSCSKH